MVMPWRSILLARDRQARLSGAAVVASEASTRPDPRQGRPWPHPCVRRFGQTARAAFAAGAGRPVAARASPAPSDAAPQGGSQHAPSQPLALTIRPTIDRRNDGRPQGSPRPCVPAGGLGRGGGGTQTHTKTEPPKGSASRPPNHRCRAGSYLRNNEAEVGCLLLCSRPRRGELRGQLAIYLGSCCNAAYQQGRRRRHGHVDGYMAASHLRRDTNALRTALSRPVVEARQHAGHHCGRASEHHHLWVPVRRPECHPEPGRLSRHLHTTRLWRGSCCRLRRFTRCVLNQV